jgi:hypothetical protein
MPQKGFCSFSANVGQISQAAHDAIQQLFNQAGVGIDFVTGAGADLSVTNQPLPPGTLGDDSGGSNAIVDMNQAVSVGYVGASFGVLIAHEWGHYVTGCRHLYMGAPQDCGNYGLMAPGTAFGHQGFGGPVPADPNLSTWQFRPDQFPAIQQTCIGIHGPPPR